MKSFEIIQLQLNILSIRPLQQNQSFRLSWENIAIITNFLFLMIATAAFLLIEANTIDEFSQSFFSLMTEIISTMSYFLFALQKKKIFKLIESLDHFTTTREIYFEFAKFNQNI